MELETPKTFRDRIATVDEQGHRKWLYPKQPQGRFYRWRTILSVFLLAFFFGAPFIKINGNQFLQFDIPERKFSLFGSLFYPQDFYLFMFAMAVAVIGIGVFTLIFGRLFCGWVCPQTVFMEMIFRRIEYWIEGDSSDQQKLNKAPWTAQKVLKKTSKQFLFFAISFLISNIFLAYIIGSDELWQIITEPIGTHVVGLVLMFVFSAVFYGVFAFMREQVCTTICPYGRLQGVLLDKDSIVIAYDHVRGENRGKFRKDEDRLALGKGDCVDCMQCVHVCPTGIDIRNGTQLECINCTACIDACDSVMGKLGLENGLIRYASENSIERKTKQLFTKRVFFFSGLLLVLSGIFLWLLLARDPVEITVLRTPGQLHQTRANGQIANMYNFTLYNKTNEAMEIELRIEEPQNAQGKIELIGFDKLTLPKGEPLNGTFMAVLPKSALQPRKTPLVIGIYGNGERLDVFKTSFMND